MNVKYFAYSATPGDCTYYERIFECARVCVYAQVAKLLQGTNATKLVTREAETPFASLVHMFLYVGYMLFMGE